MKQATFARPSTLLPSLMSQANITEIDDRPSDAAKAKVLAKDSPWRLVQEGDVFQVLHRRDCKKRDIEACKKLPEFSIPETLTRLKYATYSKISHGTALDYNSTLLFVYRLQDGESVNWLPESDFVEALGMDAATKFKSGFGSTTSGKLTTLALEEMEDKKNSPTEADCKKFQQLGLSFKEFVESLPTNHRSDLTKLWCQFSKLVGIDEGVLTSENQVDST
jgi:hypothetical protein